MADELPDYYFRVRDNGAVVFRLDTENRQRRIEMDQIAVVNTRNGEIKPQGDRTLSDADLTAIRDWMADRVDLLARRDTDDILRTVDRLNLTAHWAQSRATDAQLEEAIRRIFVTGKHRKQYPERQALLPLVEGRALALDIDTVEEARAMGGDSE